MFNWLSLKICYTIKHFFSFVNNEVSSLSFLKSIFTYERKLSLCHCKLFQSTIEFFALTMAVYSQNLCQVKAEYAKN